MASKSMTFSLTLEAVTDAFSKNMGNARKSYTEATRGIMEDSTKLASNTSELSAKMKDIFTAKDASGITTALKSATQELNNTKQGATLAAQELKLIGAAGKQATTELTGSLKLAQAELTKLQQTKATPADIDATKAKIIQLKQDIANSAAAYAQFQAASTAAMRRAAVDAADASKAAQGAGKAIYEALNIKSGGTLRTEIASLTREFASFKANSGAPAAEIERVSKAATARLKELSSELSGIGGSGRLAAGGIKDLIVAGAGLAGLTVGLGAVKDGIVAVLAATMRFDALNKQLEYATGNSAKAAQEFDFIRGVVKDMGLELFSSAEGFAKLASATKGTRLEGEKTRELFKGIAAAAASMNLTADQTGGVILALSQIMGKGKVSMEELRGQLGERLTPAFAIAAKSMGVTTDKLEEMVAAGLDSASFLEKFGPALLQTFGPTAASNVSTLAGQVNLLKNQFSEVLLQLGTGENGLGGAAIVVLQDLRGAIEKIQQAMASVDPVTIEAVQTAFSQLWGIVTAVAGGLFTALSDVVGVLDTLLRGVTGITTAFGGMGVSAEEPVNFLTRALQGVGILLGTLRDGIGGISIAFTLTTGVVQSFFAAIALGLSKVTFGDLSAELEAFSLRLQTGATQSFDKASQAALNFKSAAVQAADDAANAGVAGAAKSQAAYTAGATAAAGAQGQVGTAAAAAATSIELSSMKGEVATLKMVSASQQVVAAFKDLAKESGVNLPVLAQSVLQIANVMAEVALKSNDVARAIGKNLPEAIAKLSGAELREFQTTFIKALQDAGVEADLLNKVVLQFAEQSVKSLGGDIGSAVRGVTQQFIEQETVLGGLIGDMDKMGQAGVDAGRAVALSLEAMLVKARNPVEVQTLIDYWARLGKQGAITGQQLVEGLNRAKNKLDELKPGINSLQEAFKTFGLQSREEAAILATKYGEAFDVMKTSGKATSAELRAAFEQLAQVSVSANKGVIDAALKAKASMAGLSIQVDADGKVIVRSMKEAENATRAVGNAAGNAAGGFGNMADQAERVAKAQKQLQEIYDRNKVGNGSDLVGKSGDVREAAVLQTDINQAIAKRYGDQAVGNDKANLAFQLRLQLENYKRNYGNVARSQQSLDQQRNIAAELTRVEAELAKELSAKVAEDATKTASRAAAGGIVDAAVNGKLENVARPVAGGMSTGAAASLGGGTANKQVLEFVAPDGSTATVATLGSTSAQDVLNVLKRAGANSSSFRAG